MSPLDRLAALFKDFPGIGPRQARRFVYFLLASSPAYRRDLAKLIETIANDSKQCASCFRYFQKTAQESSICRICANPSRGTGVIMAVERDVDIESVERSGAYLGRYFVMGGVIPLAAEEPDRYVRLPQLIALLEATEATEVILGFSATAEGDHTRLITEEWLSPLKQKGLAVSVLGRGLSTGAELEYADPETIRAAIEGKH